MHVFPLPGPYIPIPFVPPYVGGSPVPPWLQRDLGVDATQVTVKGHEGWRADFRK